MEAKKGRIYKVTSPSGRIYIGQTTTTLKKRKIGHICLARKIDTKFARAIRKYGENLDWEIIEDDINIDKLNEREIFYISKFDSMKNGYNGTLGGAWHDRENVAKKKITFSDAKEVRKMAKKNIPYEEISKKFEISFSMICDIVYNRIYVQNNYEPKPYSKKRSELQNGKNNSFYGRHHSEKTKKQISMAKSAEKSPTRKLNWSSVREIRKEYKRGKKSYEQLAKEYNMGSTAIEKIVKNISWVDFSYIPPKSKYLTEDEKYEIKYTYNNGSKTMIEVAKMFNISSATVCRIVNKEKK